MSFSCPRLYPSSSSGNRVRWGRNHRRRDSKIFPEVEIPVSRASSGGGKGSG
jgi:hypothetical protein